MAQGAALRRQGHGGRAARADARRVRLGRPEVRELVDSTLAKLNAPPTALFSTLGRVAARALETAYLLDWMDTWLESLAKNMNSGDLRTVDT